MIEDRSYGKGRARHASLSHRYSQGSATGGEMESTRCPELKQSLCSGYAGKFSHSTPGNK